MMKTKPKNVHALIQLLVVIMISFSHTLIGVTGVWSNGSLPGFWNNNANWFPNTGFPNGVGQNAGFIGSPTAAVGNIIDSTTNITIEALHVDIPTGEDLNIQFTAPNFLTFSSTQVNSKIFKSGTGDTTINTPIFINSTLNIYFDNGSVEDASLVTGDLILSQTISGPGNIVLVGNTLPSLNLTSLFLEGNNTYSGLTRVLGGVLKLNSATGHSIPASFQGQAAGKLEMLQSNQFATTTILTLQSGFVADIMATTQSVQALVLSEASFVDSLANLGTGTLTITSTGPNALQLLGTSTLYVPHLNVAGGIISNGHSVIGDATGVNAFTLGVGLEETDLEVSQTFPRAENNYELVMYNPVMPQTSEINLNIVGNSGTLALTGNNPLAEVSRINVYNGQLIAGLNSTDVIKCIGDTNILPNGILLGFGTYSAPGFQVISQGLVEPGDNINPGTLILNGHYTQEGGSVSIKAPTTATASKLVVKRDLTLNGGTLFFEGDDLAPGDNIVVIDNTGAPGPIIGNGFTSFIPILNASRALKAELVYTLNQVIVRISDGNCPSENPLPPTNLRAREFKNKFLTETDHIIQLKWSASPTPGIISYNIFRNGKKIGNVKASQPLVFNDHDRSTHRTYVYQVTAVDGAGNESSPTTVKVKKHRRHSSSSGQFPLYTETHSI